MTANDMSQRSARMKRGPERAPHRALLYALGLSQDELERPFIGVVNSFNELVPGTSTCARSPRPSR